MTEAPWLVLVPFGLLLVLAAWWCWRDWRNARDDARAAERCRAGDDSDELG
jgi:ABC-type nickel/cobalt efflux system permease component RcnA